MSGADQPSKDGARESHAFLPLFAVHRLWTNIPRHTQEYFTGNITGMGQNQLSNSCYLKRTGISVVGSPHWGMRGLEDIKYLGHKMCLIFFFFFLLTQINSSWITWTNIHSLNHILNPLLISTGSLMDNGTIQLKWSPTYLIYSIRHCVVAITNLLPMQNSWYRRQKSEACHSTVDVGSLCIFHSCD